MPKTKQVTAPTADRHPVMTALVYAAMAIVATAFALGLYLQSGVALMPSILLGAVLFLVVASSEYALNRARKAASLDARIDELEAELGKLLFDRSRMDEVVEAQAQYAHMPERMETLDTRLTTLERLAEEYAAEAEIEAQTQAQAPIQGGLDDQEAAMLNRLVVDVDRLDTRLEALRNEFHVEGRGLQDKITTELTMLEKLVKQMAERMAATAAAAAAAPQEPVQAAPVEPAVPEPQPAVEPPPVIDEAVAVEEVIAAAPEVEAEAAPLPPAEQYSMAMLDSIRASIEANRIDLYLQPIVTLPQRKVRYYEALTRLREDDGTTILPSDYLKFAEDAGMMPLIDNIMLFRSVQVLRRLNERSSAQGVFCNVSVHSLVDAEFFPEFIAFMEQNRTLADSLYFEFRQDMIEACGPIEIESLNALAALGYRFSLDGVRNLDVDFRALHERNFRFIKIDADLFLNGMADAGAHIHSADMATYLDRFGLSLIVEKIEDERTLASILEHDVTLAQGFLFSEPRPVRPEVYGQDEDAVAA